MRWCLAYCVCIFTYLMLSLLHAVSGSDVAVHWNQRNNLLNQRNELEGVLLGSDPYLRLPIMHHLPRLGMVLLLYTMARYKLNVQMRYLYRRYYGTINHESLKRNYVDNIQRY